MPKPVTFDGANITIAANQEPYFPLPARIFGDSMGTVLCCWEFTEEELAEIITTKRLWSSHWSFNQPFQPMMLSVEQPVREVPEPPGSPHNPAECEHCLDLALAGVALESSLECAAIYTGTWKVVCIDNFDRETRSDSIVKDGLTITEAIMLRNEKNGACGDHSEDYHVIRKTGAKDFVFEP
jgi:hypothetical protein